MEVKGTIVYKRFKSIMRIYYRKILVLLCGISKSCFSSNSVSAIVKRIVRINIYIVYSILSLSFFGSFFFYYYLHIHLMVSYSTIGPYQYIVGIKKVIALLFKALVYTVAFIFNNIKIIRTTFSKSGSALGSCYSTI